MMKLKTLLLATAIGLALSRVGLCRGHRTLKFWDNQQTESGLSQYQQEAVKSFEAENPGIKVEVTTIPYPEYQQRLLTAVQGGNAPDVSTVDQIWVAAFAEAGAIEPLDDMAKAAGVKRRHLLPRRLGLGQLQRQALGHPVQRRRLVSSPSTTTTLLKAAGVDPASIATFEGLKAAAEKLTDAARASYGIGLFAPQGRGHRRGVGLLHLLERRQGARRQRQMRADQPRRRSGR